MIFTNNSRKLFSEDVECDGWQKFIHQKLILADLGCTNRAHLVVNNLVIT